MWVIIVIVFLVICYKIGSREEKNGGSFNDNYDDDINNEVENINYKYLTYNEILDICSKILEVPCQSHSIKTGYGLTNEILRSPLQVEKIVDTVMLLEDSVFEIYVKEECLHIEVGDDEFYRIGDIGNSVHNKYVCKIAEFEDTLEGLKRGDKVTVVGILQRENRYTKHPQVLDEAVVVKINDKFVPEVLDFLIEEQGE